MDWLADGIGWILDLGQLLKDWFGWLFALVVDTVMAVVEPMLGAMFDGIGGPGTWEYAYAETGTYISALNAWVPLTYGMTLLVMWFSVMASVMLIRWTMRFVPFM